MTVYWYRFEEQRYAAPLDEYDMPLGNGRLVVHLRKLKVLRETPKGVQLIGGAHGRNNPRFVLHESRKKFAHPDRAAAWSSFAARKLRQIKIYKARIATAEEALTLAGRFEEGPDW